MSDKEMTPAELESYLKEKEARADRLRNALHAYIASQQFIDDHASAVYRGEVVYVEVDGECFSVYPPDEEYTIEDAKISLIEQLDEEHGLIMRRSRW